MISFHGAYARDYRIPQNFIQKQLQRHERKETKERKKKRKVEAEFLSLKKGLYKYEMYR